MLEKGSLVISCQALADEPLHSSFIMGRMALAAKEGGAQGIRANSVADIREIKSIVDLPIIGIIKQNYGEHPVYITPTMKEIDALVDCGVEIIAMDATENDRPDGMKFDDLFRQCQECYPQQKWMADCSTLAEMLHADELGFDFIGTTLIGYTEQSQKDQVDTDDFAIVRQTIAQCKHPVICEGHIDTPEKAKRVLELGCYAVVVGGAVTRPQLITKKFSEAIARKLNQLK